MPRRVPLGLYKEFHVQELLLVVILLCSHTLFLALCSKVLASGRLQSIFGKILIEEIWFWSILLGSFGVVDVASDEFIEGLRFGGR